MPGEWPDAPGEQELTDELRDARPAADPVGVEALRANVERALFGREEPGRIDRFELREPIAGGGMGMIHRAYDPKLERDVALKLLHPRLHGAERAKARLIAEARVLARLSHPNVVPAYEVAEVADQIVIVMELVEGHTLLEWERAAPRSRREVVAVYAQAARGLAAAHDVGIVHRDFKPANAIIGNDGRVRVLDFGLARHDASPDDEPASIAKGSPELTASGEVLGTIAYMAPEQLAGETATAASDQFSFCVALHRALYGAPPFAGADVAELRAAIARGYDPPASAPAWLRALLARGLDRSPDQRYPSMRALLVDLERERGWRRWRMVIVAGTAAVAVAGALALTFSRNAPHTPTCDEEVRSVDRAWNAAKASRIQTAFDRVGTPYAGAAKSQVFTVLDGYRDRWSRTHRAACVAQRAAPDDVKLAAEYLRKRSCLERRLQDLSNAVEVLGDVDAAMLAKAVDVAAGLPPVEECADADALPEEPAAPASASAVIRVAALRTQLSRATTLERAGRTDDALALAGQALTDAQQLGYAPAVLDATLAKGTLLLFRHDFDAAIPLLTTAEALANEQHQSQLAVVAGARRIYAEGVQGLAAESLAGRAEALELFSRGLRSDHFARPLLLNYIGVVSMTRDDLERARKSFEAASHARDGLHANDRELAGIDMNLAMLTRDHAERERLARAAWQRFESQLGPTHLTTLIEQCRYAHYTRDPVSALQLARDASDKLRTYHPTSLQNRVVCLAFEATLTHAIEAPSAALPLYEEILTLTREVAQPQRHADAGSAADIAAGYAALVRDDLVAALAGFDRLIRTFEKTTDWWDQLPAAEGFLGAAIVEEALADRGKATERAGHHERARQHFEDAISRFETVAARSEHLGVAMHLALARGRLARLLRDVDAPRSGQLAAQARAFYSETNPAVFRAELDALP
jgi:tetratricopeptide (TPR) repeat protein/predicted Ser/Thr protein kinase